jgi:hypothetical protein
VPLSQLRTGRIIAAAIEHNMNTSHERSHLTFARTVRGPSSRATQRLFVSRGRRRAVDVARSTPRTTRGRRRAVDAAHAAHDAR